MLMLKNDLDFICMIDMHAHLLCLSEECRGRLTEQEMSALAVRELAARQEYGIDTVFSCGTPQEWAFMWQCLAQREAAGQSMGQRETRNADAYCQRCMSGDSQTTAKVNSDDSDDLMQAGLSGAMLSFGIHPWYSDRFDPSECREYYKACPIIGEIGMDSVWCEVPLTVQRRVFARQLEIAAELKKPVVLHTKGQERQIAEMIRAFPGKVCVHWYSGDEKEFETFLELGCYFTLGPDLAERCASVEGRGLWNGSTGVSQTEQQAVLRSAALYQRMLREVPAERLFLETDGLSSIAWMRGQETDSVSFRDISEVLENNLKFVAREKGMQPGQLSACLKENFHEFMS